MMKARILAIAWQFLGSLQLLLALRFSPVTQEVGLSEIVGRIAAFADFNADKVTDVLVLNSTGSEHTILLWNSKSHRFIRNDIKLDAPSPVAEVRTGDFNGDGVVDILTLAPVLEVEGRRCYTPTLYLCHVTNDGRVTVNSKKTAVDHLGNMSSISLPLVLDINGDHIPDLFATTCNGNNETLHTPTFFVSTISNNGSITFIPHPLLHPPSSPVPEIITNSYFVDLDSDCLPELVLYRDNRSMEVWKEREGGFVMVSSHSLLSIFSQDSTKVVGLPIFADMDGDGLLEVVLFSCYDSQCDQTAVHVLHLKKFSGADVVGCQGAGDSWKLSFTSVMTVNLTGTSFNASSLHLSQPTISDLDLDGYPDIVVSVFSHSTSSDGSKSKGAEATTITELQCPLVLLGSAGGRLRPQWELFNEAAVANVTQAAFFDLWEDGILDMLMVQGGTLRGDEDIPPAAGNLLAYRQSLSEDHTFLKVLVLSGHCFQDCGSGQKPYGSVLPGATVSFSTTGRTGHNERSVANIQYSSSNSLQLPFVLFGLGETPNFIEALTVGAGYRDSDMENGNWTFNIGLQFHQWSLLVPNSQVIVIPSPIDNAKSWHIELYLTPSNLVYSTAGVLCALAVGIAIIIGLLQAREKYQDSKEKKQAKHRFHFNAM